jgi:3-phosphoshikimate 1-carboxyvinyltransferase
MIGASDSISSNDDAVAVSPINRLHGELRMPGDKSISHRAAMLSALADGESILKNFSSARDCLATLECLQSLGVDLVRDDARVIIQGSGPSGLKQPARSLDAQNSGTTMRLLAGVLAGQPVAATITGDDSLRARPMLRVAEPLRLMGARIDLEANGCAPLHIEGRRPLQPLRYRLPVASAQIKSAVLLAGLAANGITSVEEPAATRDHTERMLPQFGGQVTKSGSAHSIQGGTPLHCCNLVIPGDISSAAFFIAAAVVLPNSDLFIRDIGLNPTRTAFLSTLRAMGADIEDSDQRLEGGEPVGTIHVRGRALRDPPSVDVSEGLVSSLIDELPLLAFVAASIGGEMKLSNAKELRVKESDRVAASVANLSRMGARIEERPDGWQLQRGGGLHGAQLSSFGDHRIAMACAVAALVAKGPSQIEGAREAVSVSLPEFWILLESIAE